MNKKELVCYDTDASRLIGKAEKVLFPKTSKEVEQLIKKANKDIVPRGSGTNIVGGCVPNNSIVVDMRKMNKVFNFDPMKKTVDVEAGVTLKELNEKLVRVGFEFPIESFNNGLSTLGGMVALNIPGFRSMTYGRIRDWIEQIEFVNGRGELMKIGKSDLMDVCGMEGITGIITSVILKIIPKQKRSASIFQAEDLDEIFSIARRLKLEKEIVMLEFFPPKISKLLGLPGKYYLVIEFDSERGKIKGEEYEVISKFKYKVYDVLYSEGYYNSEDPKFFFDKLKDFILFLESNQIPYFGYLGIGLIHPFFKDNEKQKQKEVIDFVKKVRARASKYGLGLNRKDLVDVFEKKVLQRVKLRYDPFGKLNKNKIIDFDVSNRRFSEKEKHHLKPVRREEFEEIKPLVGEERGASEIVEELKTPNEKIQEFIEKAELMDKIVNNAKPTQEDEELEIIEKKERKLELDNEIRQRIKDYEQTFDSELEEDRMRKVEDFALNVGRQRPISSIDKVKEQKEIRQVGVEKKEQINYKSIQDIMTNKRKTIEPTEKSMFESISVPKPEPKVKLILDEKESNNDKDMIKDIMNNSFGFNSNKEDDENDKSEEEKE